MQAVTRIGAGKYSDPLHFVGKFVCVISLVHVTSTIISIFLHLTVGIKNSTITTSKPVVVLISTLVPSVFLLCGLVAALIFTVVKLKKKLMKRSTNSEEVVEYASTLIIPVHQLSETSHMPPPLPQTPPPSLQLSENTAYGWYQSSARNALTMATSCDEVDPGISVHSEDLSEHAADPVYLEISTECFAS